MIVLRNSVAQVVQPGATVALDTVVNWCGTGEWYRQGLNLVRLRTPGVYELQFSGNVSGDAAGTLVQLGIAVEGAALPETVMTYTPTAAGDFGNISTGTFIKGCTCGFNSISVVNTGTTPVTLSANFNLRISRVG